MNQTSIFDMLYPQKKITKPIRMITFFSGYDSQCLAMKYLGVKYEHYKTCEWAVKSIQALKDIHFTDEEFKDTYMTKEQMVDFLYNKGISTNYNEPMTKQQIERLSEEQLEKIIKNIFITHNLVNIQQVKGKDLEITDTDKYEYILTYSFPCQDLSLAGKGKGMSDTSTRSGMLWEVERILTECYELGTLPQILLMENVPQVHGADNVQDFNKWQLRLEELGYKNYWQDLIATDYGIPQTRNRCFMISILGDYSYTFPKPIPLKLKLKDLLEDNVDEKYYLSNKMIEFFTHNEEKQKENGNGFRFNVTDGNVVAKTITTRAGSRMDDNFIGNKEQYKRTMAQELCDELIEQGKVKEYDVIRHSYSTSRMKEWEKRNVETNNEVPTLDTRCDCLGVAVKNNTKQGYLEPQVLGGYGKIGSTNQYHLQNRIYDNQIGVTITTTCNPNYIDNNLRIRKLTPRECGRLMNVKDEDIDKVKLSDAAKYHIYGDSICTNVLMAIFGELLDIDWKTKLEGMLNGNTN